MIKFEIERDIGEIQTCRGVPSRLVTFELKMNGHVLGGAEEVGAGESDESIEDAFALAVASIKGVE